MLCRPLNPNLRSPHPRFLLSILLLPSLSRPRALQSPPLPPPSSTLQPISRFISTPAFTTASVPRCNTSIITSCHLLLFVSATASPCTHNLGDSPSGCKLSAVKDLCLACIEDTLSWKYGTTPEIGTVFFTDQMWDEWDSFYRNFYTEEEELEIEFWESEEEVFLFHDRSMQRIMPWLSKRGVRRTCPHVAGACRDIRCCRGTEAVVVSADSE